MRGSSVNRRLGRPCQGDAGETRLRILREARNAFTTRGYDNTTNREICLLYTSDAADE